MCLIFFKNGSSLLWDGANYNIDDWNFTECSSYGTWCLRNTLGVFFNIVFPVTLLNIDLVPIISDFLVEAQKPCFCLSLWNRAAMIISIIKVTRWLTDKNIEWYLRQNLEEPHKTEELKKISLCWSGRFDFWGRKWTNKKIQFQNFSHCMTVNNKIKKKKTEQNFMFHVILRLDSTQQTSTKGLWFTDKSRRIEVSVRGHSLGFGIRFHIAFSRCVNRKCSFVSVLQL